MKRILFILLAFLSLNLSGQNNYTSTDFSNQSKGLGWEYRPYKMIILKHTDKCVYVRTKYNETQDKVEKILMYSTASTSPTSNNCVSMQATYIIPNTNAITYSGMTSGTLIHISSDDIAPTQYNGVYMGANHGLDANRYINATGHGKTAQDQGSRYKDGANKVFRITYIESADKLWIAPLNTGTYEKWAFNGNITGATLTHVSGGTNTGDITIASSGQQYLMPSIKNQTKKALIDGVYDIVNEPIGKPLYGNYIDFIDEYDIANPAGSIDSIEAHVGSLTQTPVNLGESQVYNSIVYHYASNGSCTIYYTWIAKQVVDINYMGFTQMAKMTPVTTYNNVFGYLPGVDSIQSGTPYYDFDKVENITTNPTVAMNFTSTYWKDTLQPPSRWVELLGTSAGVMKYGFSHGYNLNKGDGADRINLVNKAWRIHPSSKSYPQIIDDKLGDIPANGIYSASCFRYYYDASNIKNATNFQWYEDGEDIIVNVDYHTDVAVENQLLPKEFLGYRISVLEQNGNITIHNDEVLNDGIYFTVTNNYGNAILKLTKTASALNLISESQYLVTVKSDLTYELRHAFLVDTIPEVIEIATADVYYHITNATNDLLEIADTSFITVRNDTIFIQDAGGYYINYTIGLSGLVNSDYYTRISNSIPCKGRKTITTTGANNHVNATGFTYCYLDEGDYFVIELAGVGTTQAPTVEDLSIYIRKEHTE